MFRSAGCGVGILAALGVKSQEHARHGIEVASVDLITCNIKLFRFRKIKVIAFMSITYRMKFQDGCKSKPENGSS